MIVSHHLRQIRNQHNPRRPSGGGLPMERTSWALTSSTKITNEEKMQRSTSSRCRSTLECSKKVKLISNSLTKYPSDCTQPSLTFLQKLLQITLNFLSIMISHKRYKSFKSSLEHFCNIKYKDYEYQKSMQMYDYRMKIKKFKSC